MKDWIDDELVNQALKTKSQTELEKAGVKFCISKDFKYCIVVRKHAAWEIKKEGWRDATEPPKKGGTWRWVLNFYSYYRKGNLTGSWFKIFVPLKYEITGIEQDGNKYHIITSKGTITGKFSSHEDFVWDFMTGNAEKEEEIESKFLSIGKA